LRYLVVTRSIPQHQLGGMEYYAWDTANWLAKLGNEVTLLTTELDNAVVEKAQNDTQAKLVCLPKCAGGSYSKEWWQASKDYYLLHQDEYDAVISVSVSAKAISKLKKRCPVIMQCHGTARGEVIAKWRSKSLLSIAKSIKNIWHLKSALSDYKDFDTYAAVGDRVEQDLKKWPLNLNSNDIHLIRNGVERPTPIERTPNNEKRVISVSRLNIQKGVHHTVAAFASNKLAKIRFDIAGTGPAEKSLKKQINNHKNIKLLGAINRSEIPNLLQTYDAFVFTSTRIEGYPLNLIEALAAGLPVVASDHLTGALPDVEGIYPVDPRNPTEVALAIEKAVNSPRPTLPDQYYLEHVMQQYAEVCEGVCKAR